MCMRFWLSRGVDGFRVDVIWHLIKDADFRDNPPNPALSSDGRAAARTDLTRYTTDQPEVHDVIARDAPRLDEYDDRVLIGEIYLPLDRLVAYYGSDWRRASAVQFRAALDAVGCAARSRNHRRVRGRAAAGRLAELGAGQPRPTAGREPSRARQARVAAMLLLTLRGTPTLYYGDEIGMQQVNDPPGTGAGSLREERAGHRRRPRRLPHADAMGRDRMRGIFERQAVAAAGR